MCIRDRGYDFSDTAECYTGINHDGSISYNEELVGEAVHDFRDEVIIATKFGVDHKGDHLELDSSPERIRRSLEGSLKRLHTDYIDLYYQHRIDPKVEPEVVAGVMKELIEEGKIRACLLYTSYPIAKLAAKIALGYTLDEIVNAVTGKTYASYEPVSYTHLVISIPTFFIILNNSLLR